MAKLTAEQLNALSAYHSAADRLSAALTRISKHLDDNPHTEPAWVLNDDLTQARKEMLSATYMFEVQFGFKPPVTVHERNEVVA